MQATASKAEVPGLGAGQQAIVDRDYRIYGIDSGDPAAWPDSRLGAKLDVVGDTLH